MNRHIPHNDKGFEKEITDFISNLKYESVNTLDFPITINEVINAGQHLKKGKAPGVDGIRSEMIKEGITILAPSLTNIFNSILACGNFPSKWRTNSLTVIHKKGDQSIPK